MGDDFDDAALPTRRSPSREVRSRVTVIADDLTSQHDLPARGAWTIGRSPDADLVIKHPSVSRHHARLEIGAGVMLEDLESINGTRVGGIALSPRVPIALGHGQIFELGDVTVVLETATSTPTTAQGDGDHLVERVARSMISVLIVGETGAGKEVLAEQLHARSRRAGGPLVKLNCAALPETLLESELFGHEKGAFTNAIASKAGLLESAEGGTVFLDEVAEMSPAVQAKLLRVLEAREVLRVGGLRAKSIDVRFISATHRDLDIEIAAGRFRQDLRFRIDGITMRVPPLRERLDELPALIEAVLADAAAREDIIPPAVSPELVAALRQRPWPGNIRELRNVLARALLRWERGPLQPEHVRDSEPAGSRDPRPGAIDLRAELDDVEKQKILAVLDEHDGNQTRAAKSLGISRRTLVKRLTGWGLTRRRS